MYGPPTCDGVLQTAPNGAHPQMSGCPGTKPFCTVRRPVDRNDVINCRECFIRAELDLVAGRILNRVPAPLDEVRTHVYNSETSRNRRHRTGDVADGNQKSQIGAHALGIGCDDRNPGSAHETRDQNQLVLRDDGPYNSRVARCRRICEAVTIRVRELQREIKRDSASSRRERLIWNLRHCQGGAICRAHRNREGLGSAEPAWIRGRHGHLGRAYGLREQNHLGSRNQDPHHSGVVGGRRIGQRVTIRVAEVRGNIQRHGAPAHSERLPRNLSHGHGGAIRRADRYPEGLRGAQSVRIGRRHRHGSRAHGHGEEDQVILGDEGTHDTRIPGSGLEPELIPVGIGETRRQVQSYRTPAPRERLVRNGPYRGRGLICVTYGGREGLGRAQTTRIPRRHRHGCASIAERCQGHFTARNAYAHSKRIPRGGSVGEAIPVGIGEVERKTESPGQVPLQSDVRNRYRHRRSGVRWGWRRRGGRRRWRRSGGRWSRRRIATAGTGHQSRCERQCDGKQLSEDRIPFVTHEWGMLPVRP